jgi:hypothetical protein
MAGRLAVCRLDPSSPIPAGMSNARFFSVTRTDEELSVVCPEESAPPGCAAEKGWVALKVAGPLDFGLTGVLSSLAAPLADAGISVFAVSTYETDYLLVRADELDRAIDALVRCGHRCRR